MSKVIGVRFRTAGKIYFFSPGEYELKNGSHVIVETSRGREYGTVIGLPSDFEERMSQKSLRTVIRPASEEDDERARTNRDKEKEGFQICAAKIREHGLDMKLIDAEYTFDNNKVLFYFTADGRVDFRTLVRDLAGIFHTRIELRQIGVRDETRIMGGMGICGRPLCCHSYLTDFAPVSIKMAKQQSLSLNPTKISGVCGRLMCCLRNEEDFYEAVNKKMPKLGDIVATDSGLEGEVSQINVLKESVTVLVESGDDKEAHVCHVDEVHFLRKKPKRQFQGKQQKDDNTPEGRPADRRSDGRRKTTAGAKFREEEPARADAASRQKHRRNNRSDRRDGVPESSYGPDRSKDRGPAGRQNGSDNRKENSRSQGSRRHHRNRGRGQGRPGSDKMPVTQGGTNKES